MPRLALANRATGQLLVLDPPTRKDGSVILPDGVDAHVVELTTEQEEQIATNLREGEAIREARVRDHKALRANIIATAKTAVGVKLTDLTAAQRGALVACVLFRFEGVALDGTVRPIEDWV